MLLEIEFYNPLFVIALSDITILEFNCVVNVIEHVNNVVIQEIQVVLNAIQVEL